MEPDGQASLPIMCCENDGRGGSRLTQMSLALHQRVVVEGEQQFLANWAQRALAVKFVEIPVSTGQSGWHPAPCLQYVVILNGRIRVEAGDGSIRDLCPGDVIRAADTDGAGHRATVTDGPARLMIVSLADSPAITVDF